MEKESMSAGFLSKTITVGDRTRHYSAYVPRDYSADKPWPLIVALHGIGERGDDGLLQTEVGIGRAIRRHADRFPCLVVMPQCPDKVFWDKVKDDIGAVIEATRKEYNIDPDRIYLTGLSMGGFGAWMYAAEHPDLFAALIPICGGGNPKDAQKLAKIPIWAFHGADDRTVAPKKSRDMVEAVKNAGGNVQYTEFPNVEHNSWDPAYENPDTIKWLLEQRRKH